MTTLGRGMSGWGPVSGGQVGYQICWFSMLTPAFQWPPRAASPS
jgi:hypothetical protein